MPSKWFTNVSPSFSISGSRCHRKAFSQPKRNRATPSRVFQATREAGLRVGKGHALGANATTPTPHAPLPIHERHRMCRPRQVIPCAFDRISDMPCPASTSRTFVPVDPPAFNPDAQPGARSVSLPVDRLNAILVETQNPGTLALRSHVSSQLCRNMREHHRTFRRPVGSLPRSRLRERARAPAAGSHKIGQGAN
jgi:hypothetical protein